MKHIKVILIVAALAVALGQAPADAGKGVAPGGAAEKGAGFTASGGYSGTLSGTIMVGGELIVVPKKVTIMGASSGAVEPGSSVTARSLYVSGYVKDGKRVAAFIVVLGPVSDKDFSETTLPNAEADPNRAR